MSPIIELADVGRAYGERVALAGVTLSLEEGETLAVFGANGAGKTTLLRILATLLRPHHGVARVLGPRGPARGLGRARADRLPRPRAAALPRPDRAREPALPRAAARRGARARRRTARRGRAARAGRRPGPHVLARDGAAHGGLPRRAAFAGAAAARRAVRGPRPGRAGAGRAADLRRHAGADLARRGRARPTSCSACATGAWRSARDRSRPTTSGRCTHEDTPSRH